MALPDDTARFLTTLFGETEQNAEFRACANDVGGGARALFSRGMEEVEAFLRRHDVDGMGIYVGVSTRRIGSAKGSRSDCAETPSLWVDIDCRKMDMTKEQAVGAMMGAPLPPSMVVDSGNGVHGYWLLKEAAIVDTASDEGYQNEERLVAVLRQLSGVFAGDAKVCELARIMRLPGTHNSKDMAKAANGGAPIPCRLIEVNERRYDIYELDDWLERQRPLLERPASERGVMLRDLPPDDPYARYAKESGARVPIDAAKAMARMSYGAADDASIHQTQLRVSGHMVQRGLKDEEIVAALMKATIDASGFPGHSWNWKREEKKIRALIAGARKHGYDDKAKAAAAAAPQPNEELQALPQSAVGGGDAASVVAGDGQAAAGAGLAGTISLDAKRAERARKKSKESVVAQDAPAAQGGDAADNAAAASSPIEEVARAVLAMWRGERGVLQVQDGEFWLCAKEGGEWRRFDTTLSWRIGVNISGMADTLRKPLTGTFLNNVRRRLSEMDELQMPADFPGFDRLGWIACDDASVNVMTGEIAEHNPAHYTTIKVACDIRGAAPDAPKAWLKLLDDAFSDRPGEERAAIVGVIQEWVGSALVRGKPKAMSRALIICGESGTGKTRLANVVVDLMGGPERVAALAVAQLDKSFGMEGLLGKTAWIRDDGIAAGDDLACEQFKNLVTGDRLNIARKNRTDVELAGGLPILLTANNLPRISDPTDAVYDRLILVELRIKRGQLPGEVPSDELDETLRGELAGILAWAIEGYRRLKARRSYDLPPALQRHTKELRDENNPVQCWIEECVVADPDSRVHRADMLVSLNSWFNDVFGSGGRNSKGFSAKTMNRHLRALMRGVDVEQNSHGQRYVAGVKLRDEGLIAWERGAFTPDPRPKPFSNSVDTVNRGAGARFA